jgi:hypothetical protein
MGLLLVASTLPITARAAPVNYMFASGTASVQVSTGGVEIGTGDLVLNGTFAIFDDATPELVDFEFTLVPIQMLNLTTPYGGFDQIVIESATLTPSATYMQSFGFPKANPGEFQVGGGPVLIDAVYSAALSTGPPPDPVSDVPLAFEAPVMTADITIGAMGHIEILQLDLAVLPGAMFDEPTDLVLKADLIFDGIAMVPEPTSTLMLILGVSMLALRRLRTPH